MEYNESQLGKILYTYKNRWTWGLPGSTITVCEHGVRDDSKSILWDEVQALYFSHEKVYEVVIPISESISISMRGKQRDSITLNRDSLGWGGKEKAKILFDIYKFIVSKIVERQWRELSEGLSRGKTISFDKFKIDSHGLYRKTWSGAYDAIPLNTIVGCHFDSGEFVVDFLDNQHHLKQSKCGKVSEIPNIHLAQTLISNLGSNNLGKSG